MIEAGRFVCADRRDQRPALRLRRAVDDQTNAGMHHRAHAHQTWFHRDLQARAGQTVIANRAGGLAQGADFGVRCWIHRADRSIAPGADDAVVNDDNRTDGHFADLARTRGLDERKLHTLFVRHRRRTTCGGTSQL